MKGAVLCAERALSFTPPGTEVKVTLPLVDRSAAAYQAVLESFQNKLPTTTTTPHIQALEADTWLSEECTFLGKELAQVYHLACTEHEHACTTSSLDLLHARPIPVAPKDPRDQRPYLPLLQVEETMVSIEKEWADDVLADVAVCVQESETPAPPPVLTPKPKKGKPIPKDKIKKFLKDSSPYRFVVTGPEHVGTTTTLRLLE